MNELKFIKRTLKKDIKRNAEACDFFDLIIDGNSLFDQIVDAESDLVSIFGFYKDANLNSKIVNEYLKTQNSELESGRTMLFVCRECGDFGCGAITTEIVKNDTSYVWKNFARENDSFELLSSDYIEFQMLEFDKKKYEAELNHLKKNWLEHLV